MLIRVYAYSGVNTVMPGRFLFFENSDIARDDQDRRKSENGFHIRNQLVEICSNPVSKWSGEGWGPPIRKSSGSRRGGRYRFYPILNYEGILYT
jgi:hypothetical protein